MIARNYGRYRRDRGGEWLVLAVLAMMIVVPWAGFLHPMSTFIDHGLTFIIGVLTAAIFAWALRVHALIAVAASVCLYFPALMLSDVLAHILFNGCVLY